MSTLSIPCNPVATPSKCLVGEVQELRKRTGEPSLTSLPPDANLDVPFKPLPTRTMHSGRFEKGTVKSASIYAFTLQRLDQISADFLADQCSAVTYPRLRR